MTARWFSRIQSWRWSLAALVGLLLLQLLSSAWLLLAGQPVTLSFYVPAEELPNWEEIVEDFEQTHRHIKIDLLAGYYNTDEIRAIYLSTFEKEDPYDLLLTDVIWLPELADNGWLKDLSDVLSPEQTAAFLRSELAAGTYQDRLYRLPFRSDIGLLYPRQDLLAAINQPVPETFEQLAEVVEQLKRQDKEWGYLWQGKQYEGLVAFFSEILSGYGGFWIDPETRTVGLDRDEAKAAAKFLRRLVEQPLSPPSVLNFDEVGSRRRFAEGQGAFLRHWGYAAADLAAGSEAPARVPHAEGHRSQGCRGGWGVSVAAQTPYPAAAVEAALYFTSAAAQKQFVLSSGYLPSRTALFHDPELVADYPYLPQLLTWLSNPDFYQFRPQIVKYSEASEILQEALWRVLNQSQDVELVMDEAAAATDELVFGSAQPG
ncbi:MAG: extracellular solute-binding protein [Leptolyngbya sp. SIO4C1]|nr:extracellular solute-binding protein [Leptolyngbya sp. SIO4C1]